MTVTEHKTSSIEVINVEQTLSLAESIGSKFHGGEVLELRSDLGGGKTTFVKGLVHGMGSKDIAHSPSFTLSNQYSNGQLTMFHFDFYRLSEAGIMRDELGEVCGDPKSVVVVEWADIVEDVLPADHVVIEMIATGEISRRIVMTYSESNAYLFPALNLTS